MRIVLATGNRGKLVELRGLLPNWIDITTAVDLGIELPEETGATFLENALFKARAVSRRARMVAIADDSGLEVDALHGAPGVRSARFAGEPPDDPANNVLLLERLSHVPAGRTARFRSFVAVSAPNGSEFFAEGAIEGQIVTSPRGNGGFGYDPLFEPRGYRRTFAEMTLDEKNAISHRGTAFRNIAPKLVEFLRAYQIEDQAGAHCSG
jgi:XTP/dITP diphosphohydrolase